MKAFRLDDLEAERAANEGAYLQFLRERNMSVGLYALDAGESDPQRPHRQDEVYFVVSGRASITVGMETTQVGRGSVVTDGSRASIGSMAETPRCAYAECAARPRVRTTTRCEPLAPDASLLSVGSPFTRNLLVAGR